jgi:lipopolysaccharide/colanic/teichoic acid biosynthesis glycosyltransferase
MSPKLSMRNFQIMKRLFDVLVSLLVLFVFTPVIVLSALLVRLKLGSPVFFRQVRPGKNGDLFEMMKFRSMLNAVGRGGKPLPDDQRLTQFGKFLRASSLDELPGLWNVLKGDMSLVGPRPLLVEYLPLYSDEQARRHEVRPGITGWAQVNGRNAISWEEKFKLDVWYVDHQSFWLDLKIFFLTVKKVFVREGINQDGQATMEKFTGSKPENGFKD